MNNDKLLMTCTLNEFIESLVYALGLTMREDEDVLEEKGTKRVKKHYVYGIKGLMELLGVSRTTASKLKNSGVLDDAMSISDSGRITVFDADLVMALLSARRSSRNPNSWHGRNKKHKSQE